MNSAARSLLATLFSCASGNTLAQNMQQSPSATGNWIVSETASPVDYSPVVVATTRSRDSAATQLSVYCRNGRTYFVVTGQSISGRGDNYAISYSVDGNKPARVEATSPPFGAGVAFQGDIVSLLQSLPEEGEITIRLTTQAGSAHEVYFSLAGLKGVRSKMAAACKWPPANSQPHN